MTTERTIRYSVPGVGMFATTERTWPHGKVMVQNADGRWLPKGHVNLFSVQHNGRTIGGKRVRGVVTDHQCDAACLNAKGHLCECSCGGANHGAGVAVTVGA
jgi:hypothetical protein